MRIDSFIFNPFQENTYIISSDLGNCLIIDPGCHNHTEEQVLQKHIENQNLKPKILLNSHAHIDHVLGNEYVSNKYNLDLYMHKLDLPTLEEAVRHSVMFGLNFNNPLSPNFFLEHNQIITLDELEFEVKFTPGHAPGHVIFICHAHRFMIAGDTIFKGSIGRTDLTGGDYNQLIGSIKNEIFILPNDYKIYSGHGDMTTVGFEKKNNPFFNSQENS